MLNRSFNDAFLTRWATHYSTFGTDDMTGSLHLSPQPRTYARDVIQGTDTSTRTGRPLPFPPWPSPAPVPPP